MQGDTPTHNETLEKLIDERTRQLEEANSLQRAVLKAAGYSVIAGDADGIINVFNPAAEALLGYSADEIVGKHTAAVFHDEAEIVDRARRLSAELGFKVKPGIESFAAKARLNIPDEDEWTYVRKDGTRIPVRLNMSALRNSDGEITGFLGIAADISEAKRQECELLAAKESADAANAAKGTFLANMSHEIRTPMNAVLGMLELLDRTELNARQSDYLRRARLAAGSLLDIINAILDISKIEAGKLSLDPEPFVVDDLLRELANMLGATAGAKQVEVLFRVDPTLPRQIIGDALRLKQILVNLAGNAIKFTQEGEVIISIGVGEERDDGLDICFSVSDTGIGISEEAQARIFDAFTQAEAGTTRRFGGTGLGLVISQRLVRMMGGDLELESEIGRGSTFSFCVPLAAVGDARDMHARIEAAARFPDLRQLRLLIVDDNAKVCEITAEMAHSLGWEADVCADGADAAAMVAAESAKDAAYDAVLLDWRMQDRSGWAVAQEIRSLASGGDVPVIVMLTANDREDLAARVLEDDTRTDSLVTKPFAASDLLDAVADGMRLSGGQERRMRGPFEKRLDGMRILVVEDNTTNQIVARELFTEEGAVVEIAGGGLVALDMLDDNPKRCDAVLMDIQMPDLDGFETTRRIRRQERFRDLPIIAMTANTMQSDREAALAAGMDEHIGKPFELAHVVATLRELTGRGAPVEAASPAPAVETVPDTPQGFDVAAALQRLGSNARLYARQARAFSGQFESTVADVRTLLEQGDRSAAAELLHTMRGVAATLGADSLAACAGVLESSIKRDESPAYVERVGTRLAELLDDAIVILAQIADEFDPAAAPPAAAPAQSDQRRKLMAALETLLAESNMRAIDTYAQLEPLLAEFAEPARESLDAAINSLDFAAALDALGELRHHEDEASRASAAG